MLNACLAPACSLCRPTPDVVELARIPTPAAVKCADSRCLFFARLQMRDLRLHMYGAGGEEEQEAMGRSSGQGIEEYIRISVYCTDTDEKETSRLQKVRHPYHIITDQKLWLVAAVVYAHPSQRHTSLLLPPLAAATAVGSLHTLRARSASHTLELRGLSNFSSWWSVRGSRR